MNQNDESTNYIDPSTVSPWPIALRYGLIWGLIGIALGLVAHVMGWNDPSNAGNNIVAGVLMGIISFAISITMLVMAIKQHRNQDLGGYITFGRAFSTGFFTVLISTLIATVWAVIMFTLIVPDFFELMEAGMIAQWEEQGLSESEIEQARGWAMMFTGPTAFTLSTFIGGLVWGSILSLIIAAIMKKDFVYRN